MRMLIQKNRETLKEVDSFLEASKFLGWHVDKVRDVLTNGRTVKGVSISYKAKDSDRDGLIVCAYTPEGTKRFLSISACAREFKMSRRRLRRLIESGDAWDDGSTTFDYPLN